ncbi:MAG TPA: helix-turn-helix transcriptional regulator [Caulobacteraceae bacterium]|jgi:transcriptional regulator with XRE-family HTH domain
MTDQNLAAEVRRLRRSRGWPQEQLAAVAGLSIRTVQRIEQGERPSAETLKALASVLDVDVAVLAQAAERGAGGGRAAPLRTARLAAAAFLTAPALWFVLTNLVVFQLKAPLAPLLLDSHEPTRWLQTPFILMGGALAAVALTLSDTLSLRWRRSQDGLLWEGLFVYFRPLPLALLVIGGAAVGAMALYVALENVRTVMMS